MDRRVGKYAVTLLLRDGSRRTVNVRAANSELAMSKVVAPDVAASGTRAIAATFVPPPPMWQFLPRCGKCNGKHKPGHCKKG